MQGSKSQILNCGSQCVEQFKAHRTQAHLRQLPLPNFYRTAAANSGPIALLYHKFNAKQLKLPETYDSSIIVFNCRGELIRTIPFQLKERVIIFQFNTDENLLILYATGVYFIVNIATAGIEQKNILGEQESKGKGRFTGGQLIADKLIIQREKTLGVVQGEAKWKALPTVRFHPEFPVFQCNSDLDNQSRKNGEIQICYINSNYEIQLSVVKGREKVASSTVLYSHPDLKTIAPLLISLAYKNGLLALFFTDFVVWVSTAEQNRSKQEAVSLRVSKSSIQSVKQKPKQAQKIVVNPNGSIAESSLEVLRRSFKDKIMFYRKFKIQRENLLSKSSSGLKYRKFYSLGWLQNVCYFSDGKKLLLLANNQPKVIEVPLAQSSFILASGQKILRVIDQNIYVFRVINNPIYYYLADQYQAERKCFSNASRQFQQKYEIFRCILQTYQNFIEKKPNSFSELKKYKDHAEPVWQQLIKAVELAMDPGLQLKILKVASWIHTMFGMARQGRELLSKFRVINGLKYEHWNRWLSYQQFQGLKSTRFLTMLLKSNMHYVADLIFDDSDSKKIIFLHWAKCKVEKQTPSTALEQIKLRYNEMKGDLESKGVFSQLALYSLHRPESLPDLALKLAESQANIVRKCMVFLLVFKEKRSLDLIDKLLQFAEQCFNNKIIQQILQTLRNLKDEITDTAWLQLLPKKPMLQAFYLKMLRSEDSQQEIQRYMEVNKLYVDLAYLSLKKQLKQLKISSLEATVPIVQKDYSKILPTLTEQLSRSQVRSGVAKLRELKEKATPISETDSQEFTKDEEFESLGQLIAIKDKNLPLAVRIFRKIKSQKVYQILKIKGKIKDAIQLAFERKNRPKLQELINELGSDEDTYGRQLLQELKDQR